MLGVLGVLALRRRGSVVSGSIGAFGLKASVNVTGGQREDISAYLTHAAESKNLEDGLAEAKRKLTDTQRVIRATVLWIDDNPDNNVNENLMFRQLGLLVTQTVSSGGARRYLEAGHFDLVITDIGRANDPEAGLRDVAELKAQDSQRPVIVYTGNARQVAESALGADAVVDTPAALLVEVLSRVSG